MVKLTKEQINSKDFMRTHTCILKAHLWFGSEELPKILKNRDYAYYDTMLYIYDKR